MDMRFIRIIQASVHQAVLEFKAKKERPVTRFEQEFFDLRQKASELKKTWEMDAASKLESELLQDVRSKGANVVEGKLSLGQYRGSRFVTSFKLRVMVKSAEEAEKLAEYLRGKYSPKWKVKSIEDDIAYLNVR